MTTAIALRVPYSDTPTVKRLGARWDPTTGQWYIPAGSDTSSFAAWLPPRIPHDGPTIPTKVALFPDRCYRCGHVTEAVVGLWFDYYDLDGTAYDVLPEPDGWFLAYDDITADVIATICPDDLLAAHGAGPLRWRTTRPCPDGYLANTCQHCGTVLGSWPLHEALIDYQAEGGQLVDLTRVAATVSAVALQSLSYE